MTSSPHIILYAIGLRGNASFPGLTARFPGATVAIVPFEEKTIAHLREALRIVKQNPADVIVCGTPDLNLQRFQTVLKFLLLLAPARNAGLADTKGTYIPVDWFGFLTNDLPRFIMEIAFSIGILASAAVELGTPRLFKGPRR